MTRVSVVVPVHNAAPFLGHVLPPLRALPADWEVVVVDDGSTDNSLSLVQELLPGAHLIRHDTCQGAWAARNTGLGAAQGQTVIFVDADVEASADSLQGMARYLDEHADVAAVFGCYDEQPAHPSPLSRFRNLLHAYVHQQSPRVVPTFWTGFGAVRRDVLLGVGGFAHFPAIEDVELGVRMTEQGHTIHLEAGLQAKHHKCWTWQSMVRTDVFGRAVPWTELMLRHPHMRRALNTSPRYRWPPFLLLAALGLTRQPRAQAAVLASYLACNLPIYRFMGRVGGPALAARSVGYLAVHHLSCLVGLATGTCRYVWRLRRDSNHPPHPPATGP